MRLFVECAFPHLGKRGGTSRKGALWARRLTERRILRTSPSRKTAFWGRHLTERRILRTSFSRKSTVWATRLSRSALFRHVAAPGRCGATPPPGCGALWRMPQLGKCARTTPRQAAGRVARGFANLGLEFGLTEKCTLKPTGWAECTFPSRRPPRVRFSVTPSPKSAVWPPARRQTALFGEASAGECAFS